MTPVQQPQESAQDANAEQGADQQVYSTGLSGLDKLLHGLRAGDNVVLKVTNVEDYAALVRPFYRQAVKDGRTVIYFRYARHRQLVAADEGVRIVDISPQVGFERFISEILQVIEDADNEAFYIFDCLSDLAVDWYSDRMLGNFFMVTCPYLYQRGPIAYFALLEHRHSTHAIDSIVATAQVILVVHRSVNELYVQALKVFKRYSATMYTLHKQQGDDFVPVTNSATVSEIFTQVPQPWLDFSIRRHGVWVRTFMRAEEVNRTIRFSDQSAQPEADAYFQRLLRMAATRDERFLELAQRYFNLNDMIEMFQRLIGTGLIGGKSLGMLLARAVIRKESPELHQRMESHDSFFVGSDVFYTFVVTNQAWWLCRRQKSLQEMLTRNSEAQEKLYNGVFPEYIQHQFREMLAYFGQSPIIVRSSSLLEDNYGNAFSGKYDSVFCANQGTLEERLQAFLCAVRTVYCSSVSREALMYRAHHGLLDEDEQMALLIQRVSGTLHGTQFFPHLAGVGFSFNPYVWDPVIDPHAGVLRLVVGLGTRAVERTDDDYTRLVALNAPEKVAQEDEERRYLQHRIDLLDLQDNSIVTLDLSEVLQSAPDLPMELLFSPDIRALRRHRQMGLAEKPEPLLTFRKLLLSTTFVQDLKNMLSTLQKAYDYPVDVEFTANFMEDGNYRINLVQCRPFQIGIHATAETTAADWNHDSENALLESSGPIIGQSSQLSLDRIIYVVPERYAALSEQQHYAVARLLGQLLALSEPGSVVMLVGPGRWGTSTPSLGIPVTFADISKAKVICEVAVMHSGLIPDVSFGTHFFNDLVEVDMLYIAVKPGQAGHHLHQQAFSQMPNRLPELLPKVPAALTEVVRVIDAQADKTFKLICDVAEQRSLLLSLPAQASP